MKMGSDPELKSKNDRRSFKFLGFLQKITVLSN